MRIALTTLCAVSLFSVAPRSAAGQHTASAGGDIPLDSTTAFTLSNTRLEWVEYRGRHALRLAPRAGHERDTDTAMVALLTQSHFKDGVIEVDVAGSRRPGYSTAEDVSGFKGIVGITFRIRGDTDERIYIRPENARVNNQLFRNRATQYESNPAFPWQRLREESPGVYESYVDIEPGAWTHLRIEVQGTTARLYVNGAAEPCLVVNDLKNGDQGGQVALWARISTQAYFANLRIVPAPIVAVAAPASGQVSVSPSHGVAADSLHLSEIINGSARLVTYMGRRAVTLVPSPGAAGTDKEMMAVLDNGDLKDGTIEVAVAGAPIAGADPSFRGFIGIAFHVSDQGDHAEVIYLRPTNGRADDQLRRNHSIQYISKSAFPWQRLRSEAPGMYESYVDLEPGVWTTMKIVISGTTAQLYVNGATQPSLVVNDLKLGGATGRVALWAHVQTEAYFSGVTIRKASQ